jgi:hypothetical protein
MPAIAGAGLRSVRGLRQGRGMIKKVLRVVGYALLALVVLAGVAVAIGPPKVPAEAIATRVRRDPALLSQAFALPVAARYGRALDSQTNGSLCGPASLRNLLRSFGEPAGDEAAVLEGSGKCQLFGVCMMGLTLDELAAIARLRTQRSVTVLRDLTKDAFREHLRRSNDPAARYVVNFHRKPIFGAGGGHHSPIGGYLEAQDLALVLDVNRDFGPWLVEADRLYAALDTVDSASGKKRGLLRLH